MPRPSRDAPRVTQAASVSQTQLRFLYVSAAPGPAGL